jgi:uncharacterized phage protein (TIGR01671 family)
MNREIEFRGKRVDNSEWVYGDLVQKGNDGIRIVKELDHVDCAEYNCIENGVTPESVGQYTGLKDKNGKKIFEGDVFFNKNRTLLTLNEDRRLYLVKWNVGEYGDTGGKTWLKEKPGFSFDKINPKDKNYMSLIFSQDMIEVVGNIHEHPELLKS